MTTTPPPIAFTNLDPISSQLGMLIGLLTRPSANNYSLNLQWFDNPLPYLKQIPQASSNILTLLRNILGTSVKNSPADGRSWYALTQQGKPTYAYIVLPTTNSGTTSIIGLGLMNPFTEGSVNLNPYLYIPLFELPIAGNPVITGQGTNPIEIGLDIKDTTERFTSGNISFDGLAFMGKVLFAGVGSSFQVQFLDIQPPTTPATYATIADLLAVKDWINVIVGSPSVTTWLNQKIGTTNQTIGSLLVDLGLLQLSESQYFLGDLTQFTNKSPLAILEGFFFKVLSQLASNTTPLVPLTGGGIYVVGESQGNGSTDYGLRLQIVDIDGASNPASGDQGDNPPSEPTSTLQLQLGKWLTGDDDKNPWLKRSNPSLITPPPGLAFYFVQADSSNNPSFHPKLELVSLGLNYLGTKDSPLVNIGGVTLGGLEPRFYLALNFDNLTPIPWAVTLRSDDLGLPLGSGVGGAASNNPVAQDLLSSGQDEASDSTTAASKGNSGDRQPVNPKFSLAAAYGTQVSVQLYDAENKPTDTIWLPIQRAFGPLNCQKIGVGWQDAKRLLSFLYFGGVKLGALHIELEGLSVGIPVTSQLSQLSSYQFDLKGLDITLKADPLEISGGLIETKDVNNNIRYDGEALIKAGTFSLTALGSYTTLNGDPSLFIFAFIDDPIGGPPPFFVTGLCGGFGYNRSLTLPTVDQVQNFPFVAGLTDPTQIGGTTADPATALAKLGNLVPPTRGENWLAVGVQFTSFELIQSHALLVVEFGNELEIDLLGLSTIKLPAEGTETFAYAELELEVSLKPKDGSFSAIAVLTSNSYVIDPACHLTGGFAFCLWFGSNPHAGDFVLSIGGYHPQFPIDKISWYPKLPRLGFNWAIDNNLAISGDAYFALTPSCIMGGGRLEALYHDGDLQAWFIAHADFLMSWKPFYYEVSIGVSIGVSLNVHFLFVSGTIRIELGASLDLWGPPTGGSVQISLWIISFTVNFGPAFAPPHSCTWDDFQSFLPHGRATPVTARAIATPALKADAEPSDLVVCHIQVSQGLYKQDDAGNWYIRPDEFVFSVDTAVPLTEIDLVGPNGSTPILPPNSQGYFVGVRPMNIKTVSSVATLQITNNQNQALQDLANNWQETPTQRDVSEALWGEPLSSGQTPPPDAKLLPNRLVGLNSIQIKPNAPVNPIVVDAVQALEYAVIDKGSTGIPVYLPLSSATAPVNAPPQISGRVLTTLSETLIDATVVAKRTSVFNALADLGIDAGSDGDLGDLQGNLGVSYQALPMVGTPDGIAT